MLTKRNPIRSTLVLRTLCIFGLLSSTFVFAEQESQDGACVKYSKHLIPDADKPSLSESASLWSCDSEALYYGIGVTADPVRARKCAILQLNQTDQTLFSGYVILATVYANGIGATQNIDLAISLMCKEDGAPAENEGRLAHLLQLKSNPTAPNFHWCDDITSGLMMGACANQTKRMEAIVASQKFLEIVEKFTPQQKLVFEKLQSASNNFISIQVTCPMAGIYTRKMEKLT